MWNDEQALNSAERWVDDWQSGIEERAARAKALSQRVAQLSATARSQDGLVEVTVDASGALNALRLDERVRRHSAEWLAEQILATVRAATAELTEQARRAAAETVGSNDVTGRALVASFEQRFLPGQGAGRATG